MVGVLHFFVYIGFFIINLELFEIIIDGIFGTHRFFFSIFGSKVYSYFTAILESFSLLTIIAVAIFFIRRNFIKIPRLNHPDLKGFAKQDANFILILEFLLMSAFLLMNASDFILQHREIHPKIGFFPISNFIFVSLLNNFDNNILFLVERSSWWFHILGVLFFLNYLYYSKHLHILLAFPNIWYSYKDNKGKLNNMEAWEGMMPGNVYANIRRPLISTQNMSHIIPLSSAWQGMLYNDFTLETCGSSLPLVIC